MLKSTIVIVLTLAVLAHGEPPAENHGHVFKGHHSSHYQNVQGQQQGQYGNVKIRQSGPSKIFGWLGSRFAKIPHYLPRFPQFPKHAQQQGQHKLPQYQAIILPEPSKDANSFYVDTKGHLPEKVKISQYDESYHSVPDVETNYSPVSVGSESYHVPESAPQIEVVPSTLLYQNQQVYSSQPQAAAPLAAPPLQQQYSTVVNDYRNTAASYASVNALPPSGNKKIVPVKQGNVPYVPQSTGPDYFDTAYRGGSAYQQGAYRVQAGSYQQQPQQLSRPLQGLGTPENNYGATFADIQSQVPQFTLANLGALSSPVVQTQYAAPQQQQIQHQQGTHYTGHTAPAAQQNIQDYANQALNNQALSSLIASIPDSGSQQNVYADYSQVAQATVQQQPVQQQQQQQQTLQQTKSDTPGVQIFQGTDGDNPVFEVLADHDAPQYEGGHPFDINKLISMIEPGAQLESAELSHAASESKTTYTAAVQQPSSSSTSGITDLLLSESDPSPSLSKVDGSKFTRQFLNPLGVNVKSSTNKSRTNSSSSLKEIMDFFQQTGGKGYIVVEKKRQQLDNVTLDSDPNRDDDLTNGPTRVNITSESFLPQLELLNNYRDPLFKNNDTLIANDNQHGDDDRDFLFSSDSEDQYIDEGQYDDDYEDIVPDKEPKNVKGSAKLNLIVPSPPSPTPDKRQPSTQKTEQTNFKSSTNSSSRNNIKSTTPKTPKTITTTTVSPMNHVTTQKSQLTTLFEPVTSGKPVIFTTTPEPFLSSSSPSNLHPNHNYFANPSSHSSSSSSTTNSYLSINPSGLVPTINPFLDNVDASVLDDPIDGEDGDLSASESQQVRSIAITVTPPPKRVVSTTPSSPVIIASSVKQSKAAKGTTVTSSSSSSSSISNNASTTTEKSVASILAPVTKKTSLAGPTKPRPAPVYRKPTPKST